MAESTTPRLALPRWSADTDTPNRTEFDSGFANLEDRAAGFVHYDSTAVDANGAQTDPRPAAGAAYDRFYAYDQGTDLLYVCVDTTGAGGWAWVGVLLATGGTLTGTLKVRATAEHLYLHDTNAVNPESRFIVDANVSRLRFFYYDAATGTYTHALHIHTDGSSRVQTRLLTADGSAAAPSLGFVNDTDTGLYRAVADRLDIVTGGAIRAYFDADRFRPVPPVQGSDGTAALPAFSFAADLDTGLYRSTADGVGVATGGVGRYQFGNVAFAPLTDNAYLLGHSTVRWSAVWAVNGTIQTSDVNEKIDRRPITPADALARVRKLAAEGVLTFRWPDGSRRHAGFSAQKVGEVHGEESAAYIDPAVEADGRANPYAAAEPTAAWYDDHVDATPPDPADYDDPDELAEAQAAYDAAVAEQRADAEAEWAEARDEFDAETAAMRTAPKGLRPAELLPDLYASVGHLADQVEELQQENATLRATVADLVARVEALEGASA